MGEVRAGSLPLNPGVRAGLKGHWETTEVQGMEDMMAGSIQG